MGDTVKGFAEFRGAGRAEGMLRNDVDRGAGQNKTAYRGY